MGSQGSRNGSAVEAVPLHRGSSMTWNRPQVECLVGGGVRRCPWGPEGGWEGAGSQR